MSTSALSPDVVAAIDDLELAARLIVEGLRAGSHSSPFHGYSAEFRQHRPYRAGDDLKHLDWKLLARTDRLYSRQFRETTNLGAMLVLDSSGSMAYPPSGVTKFRYACVMAAAFAYLIVTQGDAVGLMSVDGDELAYLPARGGRPHLRSLIARIDRLRPSGTWDPARVATRGAELLRRRGIVIALSDFYDEEEATRRELRRVRRRGHDVALLQILSPDELRFPFRDDVEFTDLESGERRVIAPTTVAGDYRAAVHAFTERCRNEAVRDGMTHQLVVTDQSPQDALREFLIRRPRAS